MTKKRIEDLDINQILKVMFGHLLVVSGIDKLVDVGLIRQDLKQRVNILLKALNEVTDKFWSAYTADNSTIEDDEVFRTNENLAYMAELIKDLPCSHVHLVTKFIYRLKTGQFNTDSKYDIADDMLEFKAAELKFAFESNLDVFFNTLKLSVKDIDFKFKSYLKIVDIQWFDTSQEWCFYVRDMRVSPPKNVNNIKHIWASELELRDIYLFNDYIYNTFTILVELKTTAIDSVDTVSLQGILYKVKFYRTRYNEITARREVLFYINDDNYGWAEIQTKSNIRVIANNGDYIPIPNTTQ